MGKKVDIKQQEEKKKGSFFNFLKRKRKTEQTASPVINTPEIPGDDSHKTTDIPSTPPEQKQSAEPAKDEPSKLKPSKPAKKPKSKFVRILLAVIRVICIIFFLLLLAGGIIGYITIGKPTLQLKNSASKLKDDLSIFKDEIYSRNLDNFDSHIDTIQSDIDNVNANLKEFDFLSKYDQTKDYYNNVLIIEEMLPKVSQILEKAAPRLKNILITMNAELAKEEAEATPSPTATDTPTSESTTTPTVTETPTPTPVKNICEEGEADRESNIDDILSTRNTTPETESDKKSNPYGMKEIIKALPEISIMYNEIEPDILSLVNDIEKINSDYIPETEILLIAEKLGQKDKLEQVQGLRETIKSMQELLADYETVSPQIKNTLVKMPELLGAEKPVTYLIVPQNEKEMRSSGGLLTAYGSLTVYQGEIVGDINTTDMWDLENYLLYSLGRYPNYVNIYGQLALMNYGCGATHLRSQDSGIYSDNYISMDIFKDYYDIANQYNPNKYVSYDHIITFNTFFASDLVKLVEPLQLEDGQIMCAKDTAKKIFHETSVDPDDLATRKSYIGEVGKAVQDKIMNLSSRDFLIVAQIVIKSINSKNISFYSKNTDMQQYFDEMGLTARVTNNYQGDYFQLNEAQNCGLKSNFYVYDVVTETIDISDEGRINKSLDIEWINEKVYDPNEALILTNSANFRYRAWIRLYSPAGTTYTNRWRSNMINDWIYYPQYYYDNIMGLQTYDDVIWFDHRRNSEADPVRKASYHVILHSPENIKYTDTDGYTQLIQKHPGKRNEKYQIHLSYKGQSYYIEVLLDRDKIIRFKDGQLTVENYPGKLDSIYDFIGTLRTFKL